MKINITLLLQILHFYITYVILSRFIFKPVIGFINKQKSEDELLLQGLENKKAILLKLEHNKKQNIIEFQKKIATQYSIPLKPTVQFDYNMIYKKDPKEIECLTQKIKDLIIREVPRVR